MPRLDKFFENFEDVREPIDCELIGSVPSWLSGTMVRNGPGLFQMGDTAVKHWFDGQAYVQRYHFKDGKMFYSARFLESDQYKLIKEKQRIVCSTFGTFRYPDPCKSIYERFMSHFESEPVTDNAGVAFIPVGDQVYAVTETTRMIRIDLDTLDSVEKVDLGKYITVNTYTAHSHSDEKGNIYNIGSKFGKPTEYVFGRTMNPMNIKGNAPGSCEATEMLGSLTATDPMNPSYYHSFGMTDKYMILLESPVRLSVKSLLFRNIMSWSYHDCIYWDETAGVNVLIMEKTTGKRHPVTVTHDAFFTFHHANSFEKDGCIVLDYCRMDNPGKFDDVLMEHMRSGAFQTQNPGFKPFLARMIVPTAIPEGAKEGDDLLKDLSWASGCSAILQADGSIHCKDIRLCEIPFEFPRYNYALNMKEYKYVYGSTLLYADSPDGKHHGIVKTDVQCGTSISWSPDHEDQLCAEPIFVSPNNANKEDDGIVLVPVLSARDENSYVVVLDAQDLEEMARYIIPLTLPMGFHAHFQER